MAITLSEKAASELRSVMAEQNQPDSRLRVWIAGGGCSGFSYGMALDPGEPEDDDVVFETNGVRLVVDPMSLQYMDGSTVDYVGEGATGGFKIDNPNAPTRCCCGSHEDGGCSGCESGE